MTAPLLLLKRPSRLPVRIPAIAIVPLGGRQRCGGLARLLGPMSPVSAEDLSAALALRGLQVAPQRSGTSCGTSATVAATTTAFANFEFGSCRCRRRGWLAAFVLVLATPLLLRVAPALPV